MNRQIEAKKLDGTSHTQKLQIKHQDISLFHSFISPLHHVQTSVSKLQFDECAGPRELHFEQDPSHTIFWLNRFSCGVSMAAEKSCGVQATPQ